MTVHRSAIQRAKIAIIKIIAAFLLALIPLPLLFAALIPSLIFRLIVRVIANIFRPDLGSFFKSKGAIFALESVHIKPKINIVLHAVVDGSITMEEARPIFKQRILEVCDKNGQLVYPQLQQTWTQFLGFLFWKWDKTFDLNNHVRSYDYQDENLAIPHVCTEDDLKRITPHLIARPYVKGRSPWEALLISNYRADNNTTEKPQFVMVVRFHHALADGYSIMKIMFKLLQVENVKVPLPTFPKLSLAQIILKLIVMPLRLPYDVASQFLDGWNGANSWHLLDQKLSRTYHTFYSDRIPVNKIKEIKNKYKVGYNPTTYAITIGAIRRLMMEAGQKVPKKMSALVPLPLPFHPGGLVVHVSAFLFSFSPQIDDPVERLLHISRNMQVLVDAPLVAAVTSFGLDLLLLLPVFALRILHNKLAITIGMSSFPGPETELEVDFVRKQKLVDVIPSIGHFAGHVGATSALLSMAGMQRIVLVVDKEIFANYDVPANFAQLVNDEIHALLHPEDSLRVLVDTPLL